MIVLDLSILNQKGTPMFNSDTFANRPAFGIVGRIFISTDTKEFFRDTGTSWELIGGPGSGTITGSGAATQVAFWNGASTITGSNNLFWDSTNNYLGISTNTPTTALDVHHSTNSGAIFNQTTGTNNNTINFQTSGSGRWRIGNFYTAGADDFGIFDVVGSLQQLTILKTTGQTFIGAKTTAAGRLVVNSATADAHLQIVGANAPSIRIDNAGSGGTQRFAIGNATATNNFIQGSAAGDFCITTASAGPLLFGMWQTTNASEVMRITTANNLLVGSTTDAGYKLDVNGTGRFLGDVRIVSNTAQGGLTVANTQSNIPTLKLAITNVANVDLALKNQSGDYSFENGLGSPIVTFKSTGNILIGTTTDAGFKLDVNGTAMVSGSVTAQLSNNAGSNNNLLVQTVNGDAAILKVQNNEGGVNISTNNGVHNFTDTATAISIQTGNVGVRIASGSGGVGPAASAMLDVISTTRGFLPPRMTTTEKNGISSPAAGLVVYDTTLNKLCVYTTAWETITSL